MLFTKKKQKWLRVNMKSLKEKLEVFCGHFIQFGPIEFHHISLEIYFIGQWIKVIAGGGQNDDGNIHSTHNWMRFFSVFFFSAVIRAHQPPATSIHNAIHVLWQKRWLAVYLIWRFFWNRQASKWDDVFESKENDNHNYVM